MGKDTQKSTVINRQFSSGGVVFKKEGNEILWLVAKNNPTSLYPEEWWRLPKGWIDNSGSDVPGPIASGVKKAKEEDLRDAALREVREESGVGAGIVLKIGTIKLFFNSKDGAKILKFVTFYLMEWEKDLPEGFDFETSEIAWLPYSKAYERLTYAGEKEVLKKAKDLMPL